MKFALLTVTYGGLFYKGQSIDRSNSRSIAQKNLALMLLAIETKRPVASPLDLNKADRYRIKNGCR